MKKIFYFSFYAIMHFHNQQAIDRATITSFVAAIGVSIYAGWTYGIRDGMEEERKKHDSNIAWHVISELKSIEKKTENICIKDSNNNYKINNILSHNLSIKIEKDNTINITMASLKLNQTILLEIKNQKLNDDNEENEKKIINLLKHITQKEISNSII